MSALVNLQFPTGGVNQSSKTAMWESSWRGILQSSSSPQEISTSTLEQNVKSSKFSVMLLILERGCWFVEEDV